MRAQASARPRSIALACYLRLSFSISLRLGWLLLLLQRLPLQLRKPGLHHHGRIPKIGRFPHYSGVKIVWACSAAALYSYMAEAQAFRGTLDKVATQAQGMHTGGLDQEVVAPI